MGGARAAGKQASKPGRTRLSEGVVQHHVVHRLVRLLQRLGHNHALACTQGGGEGRGAEQEVPFRQTLSLTSLVTMIGTLHPQFT